MESQLSEERMKLEQHLAKVCDKNGSREEARTCITNRLDQICSHFLPHFVHADTLALKYQGRYTLNSKLIYLLAAVMVTAVSAGAIFKVQEMAITLFEIAATRIHSFPDILREQDRLAQKVAGQPPSGRAITPRRIPGHG